MQIIPHGGLGLCSFLFPPYPRQRGLDLLLEARDQLAVGSHQGLLGFDLGDDVLLGGAG